MSRLPAALAASACFALAGPVAFRANSPAQRRGSLAGPVIPMTWDQAALASLEVPLADPVASPRHASADYYARIPALPIYKSYPVYAPGKEPPGYLDWLEQQEPALVFDPTRLNTEAELIKAGQLVFDAPVGLENNPPFLTLSDVRDPALYEKTGIPVARDGWVPFVHYVIRKKGTVEVGQMSCAMCHTRVMPDGSVIKGAQGNLPFDRVAAFVLRSGRVPLESARRAERALFAAPWLHPDPNARLGQMSLEEIAAAQAAIPPGVLARHGTSPFYPVQVPDLMGLKDRRYLDSTGLVRQRTIGDLMRYVALNQAADFLDRFGDFIPVVAELGKLPAPEAFAPAVGERFTDEQLYALARYLYSLQPPPHPNRRDARVRRGQRIFQREGCATCHTPPLYTNNKLTPATGFPVPADHFKKYDILPVCVGTDPRLALQSRRGTGYYKVPSLRGSWYRRMFGHEGACATLEDWFDPRRLRDDYVPTGFRGVGAGPRAVKGHPFGLNLAKPARQALIAFLKTL
jgi:rhodanese-related sulfurtransferase